MPARSRLVAIALFLAGAGAYAPTLGHGWVFDDEIVIVKNRHLRSVAGLGPLVSSTEWSGGGVEVRAWRPLTALTYAANHALSGLRPWSYHLANALLHGAVALLLFLAALRFGLPLPAAGIAGLLFALHPVHVEAVSNVIGRKDVLATLFLLGMLLAHGPAARAGGGRLALPVLAFAAALLSKEVGAVGLALALLWELGSADSPWRAGGDARRRAVLLHASYAALLAGYLVVYRRVTGGLRVEDVPFADNPAAHAPTLHRLLTAVAAVGKGLAVQLWPAGQSPDWSYDALPLATSLGDPRVLATLAALVGWLALGLRLRRAAPVLLLSAGWYLAALAPAANVLFPVGTLYGERLLYLPSAGLALLAGWGLHAAARRAGAGMPVAARVTGGAVAGGLLAALLAAATLRYSHAWRAELPLFSWAARTAPGSTKVQHKLAGALLAAGRPVEALAAIDRSLAILPANGQAELGRAQILRKLGRTAEADASNRRAAALLPGDADALYGLGQGERDAGRIDAAAARWREALARNPAHAPSLSDLSSYHLLRRETEAALAYAERAVAADPLLASGWYNLGLLHRAAGDRPRARLAFTRFVETAGAEYGPEIEAVRAALAAGGP